VLGRGRADRDSENDDLTSLIFSPKGGKRAKMNIYGRN
jgi:hypothetical protein